MSEPIKEPRVRPTGDARADAAALVEEMRRLVAAVNRTNEDYERRIRALEGRN